MRGPQRRPGVERLLNAPCSSSTKLITASGAAEDTVSRHLPSPSPREPSKPSPPDSNSDADSHSASPAGTVTLTAPPARPASSTPSMAAIASSAPSFASRSRLRCARFEPGLNTDTRAAPPERGAASKSPVA